MAFEGANVGVARDLVSERLRHCTSGSVRSVNYASMAMPAFLR